MALRKKNYKDTAMQSIDHINSSFENNNCIVGVFIGPTKAFDTFTTKYYSKFKTKVLMEITKVGLKVI